RDRGRSGRRRRCCSRIAPSRGHLLSGFCGGVWIPLAWPRGGRARPAGRPGLERRLVVRAGADELGLTPRAGVAVSATDLHRTELQTGSDFVGVEFDHGALLAGRGFEAALAQPPGDDHPVALAQGLGYMLGGLTPNRAPQVKRLAIHPLARRLVV